MILGSRAQTTSRRRVFESLRVYVSTLLSDIVTYLLQQPDCNILATSTIHTLAVSAVTSPGFGVRGGTK